MKEQTRQQVLLMRQKEKKTIVNIKNFFITNREYVSGMFVMWAREVDSERRVKLVRYRVDIFVGFVDQGHGC